jgi:L-alanine-DL-glutamate epimerase-like enolase superfamily enzyme
MATYIREARPRDVALEVEAAKRMGCTSFTLRSIDHGGMLDLERLGAARYAAGVQSVVELEEAVAAQRR